MSSDLEKRKKCLVTRSTLNGLISYKNLPPADKKGESSHQVRSSPYRTGYVLLLAYQLNAFQVQTTVSPLLLLACAGNYIIIIPNFVLKCL